jgi:RNA polymerase sigma factor (sigma-70 family)
VPEGTRARLWLLHAQGGGATDHEGLLEEFRAWREFDRARGGDPQAARGFERAWTRQVRLFAGRRWRKEHVDELAALFFERALRLVPRQFLWQCPFSAYLRTLLLNLSRDHAARLQRQGRRERSLDDAAGASLHLPARTASPEEVLLDDESCARVRRALQQLAPADRHVLMACLIDDEAGQDVAAQLGLTRDALYQRLHRAKERLRAALQADALRTALPRGRVRSGAGGGVMERGGSAGAVARPALRGGSGPGRGDSR